MDGTFEQGWAARPFKEQFPVLTDEEAKHLDSVNAAITTLSLSDMLNDTQHSALRQKKMPRLVTRTLVKAMKRAEHLAKKQAKADQRAAQKGQP